MANTRIKDLNNTATTVPSDAYVAIDGSANGTAKISRDNLRQDTADAIAAAPSTYNLAPLTSGSVDVAKGGTGSTTVDGAKTTLQVPNVGTAANEVSVNGMLGDMSFQNSAAVTVDDLTVDGHFAGTVGKPMPVNGPTMRFDGVDDHVSFAAPVGSAFSFTNGTDDTPFSSACWIKFTGSGDENFYSKYSSGSVSEYTARVTGGALEFQVRDTSSGRVVFTSNSSLSDYNGKWIHVSFTYGGSGPNSTNSFENAGNAMTMYLNGKPLASTAVRVGTYLGMTSTAAAFDIGRLTTLPFDGEIRDVKLFNKELSLAEVREVYSNGQLGFAESTGTATLNTGTFTSQGGSLGFGTVTGATATGFTAAYDTANASNRIASALSTTSVSGKRYKVTFKANTGGQSVDLQSYNTTFGGRQTVQAFNASTLTPFEIEYTVTNTAEEIGFYVAPSSAGSLVISDFRIIQIGSVLDARAEQFDTSTGKLHDLSGNDFVGTQSGGVQSLGKNFPVYGTGSWTPSVDFSSSTSGLSISSQNGRYTRCGDTVFVTGSLHFDVGSSSGNMSISGLPYSVATGTYNNACGGVSFASGLASLTSHVTLKAKVGTSDITPYDWGASGTTRLTEANFGASSIIFFSLTYKIS